MRKILLAKSAVLALLGSYLVAAPILADPCPGHANGMARHGRTTTATATATWDPSGHGPIRAGAVAALLAH